MQQPDKFICVSYSSIDFLIPNDEVFSAVGMMDIDDEVMSGSATGIFNLDALAREFKETPREANVCTMIVLKDKGQGQTSLVTTQECKVCRIPLKDFSVFPERYANGFTDFGILACSFYKNKLRFLLNARKAVRYMELICNPLEEL